jgi:polyisoprenoid-binding protein YceI
MAKWTFEPGHTAAEFCARHMMVTCVRGHFKNVHGTLDFDPANPAATSVDVTIDASGLWSGEPDRDKHLKSADFLDVANHPTIRFRASKIELAGADEARLIGELTIRGITRPVTLDVRYLGQWETPWWENGVDKGPKTRAGFLATARINRKDFGVSWNGALDRGGVVVGDEITITIDAEAIRD